MSSPQNTPSEGGNAVAVLVPEFFRKHGKVSIQAIRKWLIESLVNATGLQASEIDPRAPFSQFGLDSAGSVQIALELEEATGLPFPPTLFWEHPNIDAMAKYLSEQFNEKVKIEQLEAQVVKEGLCDDHRC